MTKSILKDVRVQFDDGYKEYSYVTHLPVEVGERVVVDAPAHGYVVVKIIAIYKDGDSQYGKKYPLNKTKRIVSQIDDEAYKAGRLP